MLLMIDNYDSFTYNLVHYFAELGEDVRVVRNDAIDLEGIRQMKPRRICLSPGPCTPSQAGITIPIIQELAQHIPILGVCLGHQAIGAALGGRVIRAKQVMHGKTDMISTSGTGIFTGLPRQFTVTRYHSLVIEQSSLPESLEITATSTDKEIMAVRHREYPLEGVQFHPESILSEHGHALLAVFYAYKPKIV